MRLLLIRHGQTAGNMRKAYIGRTDEPLCEEGRAWITERAKTFHQVFPQIDGLYVSPMLRARETAELCFPGVEQHVVDDLREMDFGDFEGKTYKEMDGDARYQAWVDSGCEGLCPNGEDKAGFCARIERAFESLLSQASMCGEQNIVVVAHGGTVMASLARYAQPAKPYFEWYVESGGAYLVEVLFSEDGTPLLNNPRLC